MNDNLQEALQLLEEIEQRLANDLQKAIYAGYPEIAEVIERNFEAFKRQNRLITEQNWDAALRDITESELEIKQAIERNSALRPFLKFILAQIFINHGRCLGMRGGDLNDLTMMKQGWKYLDAAIQITDWTPVSGKAVTETRDSLASCIKGGVPWLPHKLGTGKPHRTAKFKEVETIACPKGHYQEKLRVSGTCKGGCAWDLDMFEAGLGLVCTKCGRGYVANVKGETSGVLRCTWQHRAGAPLCKAAIPATPKYIKPVKDNQCFIATAAYGSALSPEVDMLRQFREKYLRPHRFGRWFIFLYETFSPPLARWIAGREWARFLVRQWALKPIIAILQEKVFEINAK